MCIHCSVCPMFIPDFDKCQDKEKSQRCAMYWRICRIDEERKKREKAQVVITVR